MDKIRDAIENLTLQLATARYHSAASNDDRRLMGLTVAWADRELGGCRLEAFYEAIHLDAFSTEVAELMTIGERCPEFRSCVRRRFACQKPFSVIDDQEMNLATMRDRPLA